jgi:hypothetical protein
MSGTGRQDGAVFSILASRFREAAPILRILSGYSPRLGRWASRDPVGEKGGLNTFAFVANETTNVIDPIGEMRFRIWASAFIMPAAIWFPYLGDINAIWLVMGDHLVQAHLLRIIRKWLTK